MCFFDTRSLITNLEIIDGLTNSLKNLKTLPDCVLIIVDSKDRDTFKKYCKEYLDTFKNRGERKGIPFIKSYQLATWYPTKKGLKIDHIDNVTDNIFSLPLDQLTKQGLQALITSNPVIQTAPAGHIFQHPSKKVSKLFIQAREIANTESELAFAGRCLACDLPPELAQVYIDSMSIYSLVREALNFVSSSASIHSFHSYEEISKLSPPTDSHAVIVSASTTGDMVKRLHEEQGFAVDRLITLVDMSRKGRNSKVMIALNEIDPSIEKQVVDNTAIQIELFGEHFSAKAKPPRAVTLGQIHEPKGLRTYLKQLGINGTLSFHKIKDGSNISRLICLNGSVVKNNKEFNYWLKEEIAWRVPASIDYVVYANDCGSKEIAIKLVKELKVIKKESCLIQSDELSTEKLCRANGVLVVQAIAGNGGLMREISRDLREYLDSNIPRHFMIAVGMPKSQETWLRLQQFLIKNATSREYGFSSWLTLPIGSFSVNTAWQAYINLGANIDYIDKNKLEKELAKIKPGIDVKIINSSLEKFSELIKTTFFSFFPTVKNSQLPHTDGFVFFSDCFDKKSLQKIQPQTIFVTFASVLQAARDLVNPVHQLKPTGYESVVLSPENFLRFNDSLLQACILRSAHPSELDYSSNPHLSMLMKGFLLKLFDRRNHPYGAAALEFAAALASGRLRLTPKDLEVIRAFIVEKLTDEPNCLFGIMCIEIYTHSSQNSDVIKNNLPHPYEGEVN